MISSLKRDFVRVLSMMSEESESDHGHYAAQPAINASPNNSPDPPTHGAELPTIMHSAPAADLSGLSASSASDQHNVDMVAQPPPIQVPPTHGAVIARPVLPTMSAFSVLDQLVALPQLPPK